MALKCKLVAASLFAITFFYAFGALAANCDVVYRATFNPRSPFVGSVRMHLQNDTINPIFIAAMDIYGRTWPLSFDFSHHNITIHPDPIPFEVSQLSVTFSVRSHDNRINGTRVYADYHLVSGAWTEPQILSTGILVDVIDSLSLPAVGAVDTHTVAFTTTTTAIGDSGAVWIIFPVGFDLSGIDSVLYNDNDPANDGLEPFIESIGINEHSVVFQFAASGQQATPGHRIWLKFSPVVNDTVAQDRTVIVMTTLGNGEINNDPVESAIFTLFPGPLTQIQVLPDTSMILQAGALVNFSAYGWDSYRNPLQNQDFVFAVTVDSCGNIADGAFRAHKLGLCYVTASASGILDSSGLISVIPGRLDRFESAGYPSEITAGQRFHQNIIVTAVDPEGNRKYDYLDSLWFSSGDSIDDLPYRVSNPYQFAGIDSGRAVFSGSGFALKRAGIRNIIATNGAIGNTSIPIRVISAPISRFNIAADTIQIAGVSFYVNVDNALDPYGNSSSGEIAISAASGGGSSPDSVQPTFTNIIVANGTGRSSQTLTNAVTTTLQGVVVNADSVRATTLAIHVLPGALGRFTIAGCPDYIVAGDTFQQFIHIAVFDILGNIKTDYDGFIYFTSTDTLALLPYGPASQFHFLRQYGGVHNFIGEIFSLRTSGLQTIEVTDGNLYAISNSINVRPAIINHFIMSVDTVQTAGISFFVSIDSARDIYGNNASGEFVISAASGGGSSPDGIQPAFSDIVVTDGNGRSLQTLTNAVPTTLRAVLLDADTIGATTPQITVLPGSLGRFTLSGCPDYIVAGDSFQQPIIVTVFDIMGNLKTNYENWIYFISSDLQAVLPYGPSSRFQFLREFGGIHSFIDETFSLRTSGLQTVGVTDTSVFSNSNTIHVSPAAISQFTLTAPQNVLAGTPFSAQVSGALDMWGNSANGVVTISDSINAGPSPNGTEPSFSPITVVSDSGSALQTLFDARSGVVLKGVSDSIIRVTEPITVSPDALGGFNFGVSSPQVAGMAFRDTAALTAEDRYGNIKTDFDASLDSVVISSSSGGRMSNNILNLQGDFIQGRADLIPRGIAYFGLGGLMTFQATSRSGVIGLSNQVDMSAIRCLSLSIDQATITRGDTATGTISVSNSAGRDVNITGLFVIDGANWLPDPTIDPSLPMLLGPGATGIFNVRLPIPDTLSIGMHQLTAAVHGVFGQDNVADTLPGFPDSIAVLQRALLEYIPNTLNPDTLSTGFYYSLNLKLRNLGQSALALYDSSYLIFADEIYRFQARLTSPVYISPGDTSGVLLTFQSTQIPPGLTPGGYTSTFYYFGDENGHFRYDYLNIPDTIFIQSGAAISYISGSLNIDSLVGGQSAAFAIQLQNSGQADFVITHQNTRLSFRDSQREFSAYSDTTPGVRVDTLHFGPITFHFAPVELFSNFEVGRYLPTIVISGIQNGHDTTLSFSTIGDSVKVISRAQLRIDSTYAMSLNAPFVNTSQPCSLRVLIENSGDERADAFYLHLASSGDSQFPDSTLVPYLNGRQSLALFFADTAGTAPNNNEILTSSISGGTGGMSGHAVQIMPPLDNNALLITETPAELSLSPISIIGPPGALDGSISIGQNLTIAVTVHNQGQADITGPRRLTLYLLEEDWGVDSLYRDYSLDQPINWQLNAPDYAIDSAALMIQITGNPFDENDGSSAVGLDSSSLIWFAVENRASVDHHAAIADPPGAQDNVISTDQAFIIRDILVPHGIYRSKAARLILPNGFTTQDSLVKYPLGDTVIWHLRAPSSAALDSAIILSWIYDFNYSDSSAAAVEIIPITVVNAATLRLSSSIISPPSALDGIIEPGSALQLEAIVQNLGQAGVGLGQIMIQTGRPDLITTQDSIRNFTPGIPIVWNIDMPTLEIPLPIPIWVTISAMPVDENTGLLAPAVVDSVGISVLVRELYPRLVLTGITGYSGSAVKGQTISYLTLDLQNRDLGGNFNIGITGFTFRLQSVPPVSSSDLFSSASLVSAAGTIPADNFEGNFINFTADTIILDPSGMISFRLDLTLRSDVNISDFTIGFDNTLGRAVVLENGYPTEQLNIVSQRGEPISWQSDPTAVLEPSFAASLTSYPNPFSPREGGTRIGYYLPASSDLEIKIFTLLGELVWTKSISSTEPFGLSGLHSGSSALTWDGGNDMGREIRSGVYICVVKNLTTGEEAKFKIAVVK